ncbi:response regulator [Pseudoduganella aquatica]|uniref:response regulator n=1 Tax=Pseudoduganella aquatica TaxID=2660641 RepID=UPI001E4C0D76|nr:response regulator [Pseudoduganella aquatica]
MDVKEDTSADWMIEEDVPANAEQTGPAPALAPWRVLIVDDDVDVHVVTKFSLSNACFQGRRLSFLHAYSGDEALHILRTTPDVALVLLDVIMETSEAGLKVARQIRDDLHNHLVRIVLRTGQPGQALEHSIILDYDINDFWCKSDLTTRKLFTTVISSLRGYAGLVEADRHLAEVQSKLDNSVRFVLDEQGRIVELSAKAAALLGGTEESLRGRKLAASANPD